MVMNKKRFWAAISAGTLLLTSLPVLAAESDVRMCEITCLGDADANGSVSVADVVKLTKFLQAQDKAVSINADLSASGTIDAFDLALLKKMVVGKYKPEDFSGLMINEVCASNQECWSDADGREPDWVEIYNAGKNSVNLSGYGLADGKKNLFKYVFPEGTKIEAGGYLMVCCDDGLTSTDPKEHHAPFKLSSTGETLYLTHPGYGTLDVVEVPAAVTDVTYGRYKNGEATFETLTPTPGASNSTAQKVDVEIVEPPAGVSAPEFSKESGFYASGFDLTITGASGSTILYTLDGTDPRTSSTAKTYQSAIAVKDNTNDPNVLSAITDITINNTSAPSQPVDKGMVLRAVCKDAQGNFSDVVTESYFINKNAAYYQDMRVISLVTEPDNMFSTDKGIYMVGDAYYQWRNSPEFDPTLREWDTRLPTNYNQSGVEWERPANIQIFEKGTLAYETGVGIRIAGNATRSSAQKSIRLYARSDYGDSNLKYTFFEELTDITGKPITKFDKVTLRNGGNDVDGVKFRDDLAQALAKNLDVSLQANDYCILFIDGEFWGMYSIKERLEDDYVESHYGIDKTNVTTIKNGEIEGNEAVGQAYVDFYNWAIAADMKDDANYQKVCDTIDMQSFMDYITLETYICNADWCSSNGTNNWQIWRVNEAVDGNEYGDGKWRYMVFDTEYSSALYNENRTSYNYDALSNMSTEKEWKNIGALFYKLLENETFKTEFAANYKKIVENEFNYQSDVAPLIDAYVQELQEATKASWRRFGGYNADRQISGYNSSVEGVRRFYQERAKYALDYLDKVIEKGGPVSGGNNGQFPGFPGGFPGFWG